MEEHGMYYPTERLKQVVHTCGGKWEDPKERPIVCLIRSLENEHLYWAIPMGDLSHRSAKQIERLRFFTSLPSRDIRSCYYHIGTTSKESIFFISDAICITDEYIERSYEINSVPYVIKNPTLLRDLKRKLLRILSEESRQPNRFRQHITDVKQYMLAELQQKGSSEETVEHSTR